jgi:hypothetical protein
LSSSGPMPAERVARQNRCDGCTLALGPKETAVCAPLLVMICFASGPRLTMDRWRLYLAGTVVTVAYIAFRASLGLTAGFLVVPSRYFAKQMVALTFGTLTTPWRAPTTPVDRCLAMVAVAGVTLLLTHVFLAWRRRDRAFHVSARLALWCVAAVVPVYSSFFIGPQLEGSRYLYLSECGWALLLAELLVIAADRLTPRSPVLVCVTAIAILASAITLERELGVWRRAAQKRDVILHEARAALIDSQCPTATFADVPDSLDGAYVFRNGFYEALGLAGTEGTSTPECAFRWSGNGFSSLATPRPR